MSETLGGTGRPPKVKSKGFGDTVKVITDKLGIKQCGGCKKRQEKLNRLWPYKKKDKIKK